ncbi:hypothetical protein TNCV_819041 [Trichonephila clavipes]|nr:hypothetical protein TNCV_819041 [Trichonephila clavipes]
MVVSSSGKRKRTITSNGLPSRMESSGSLLLCVWIIICNKSLYSPVCIVCFGSSTRILCVSQDKNTRQQLENLSNSGIQNLKPWAIRSKVKVLDEAETT